ncbi:MAG: DUF502 domain-containing protein [Deinococcus sp.]|nr:DUF502 domain-containing protein [Deinococcus sp.]
MLPIGITIYFAALVYNSSGRFFRSLYRLVSGGSDIPPPIQPALPIVGLVALLLLIYLVGLLARTYIGSRVVATGEWLIATLPFIRDIYGATKQISRSLFERSETTLTRAALIEYPRRGIWVLGFVTGRTNGRLIAGKELLAVLIPTSPMPASGFVVFVEPQEVIPLDLSAEEAFRIVISGGFLVPTKPDGTPLATVQPPAGAARSLQ